MFCRESVELLVSQYDENYEGYLKVEEDLCNWMQLILSSMRIKGVQLVDNKEFLEYMRTQINDLTFGYGYGGSGSDEPDDAGELPENLRELLLTADGATSLDTVEALDEALSGLFYYRGPPFEAIALAGFGAPPLIDSCSQST